MKRELRLREVQVLDTARKNFIETAELEHKEKLKYLEEEVITYCLKFSEL